MSGKEQFAEVLVSKGASYTEGQFSREAGWQRDRCYVTFPYIIFSVFLQSDISNAFSFQYFDKSPKVSF